MLNKAADFYEREVREAVDNMSKLIEPIMISVLGGLVGTLVVAMYLPIFKMGSIACTASALIGPGDGLEASAVPQRLY